MELVWNKLNEQKEPEERNNALEFYQWLDDTLEAHFSSEHHNIHQTKNETT